jgi:flagellar motor switch protein FliG
MTGKAQAEADSNARPLRGAEKVAVLLLALGRPKAASLLKRFDAEEIKLIARAASELPPVSPAGLAELVEDFARMFAEGSSIVGTAGEVKDLLGEIMSEEEIAAVLSDAGEGSAKDEPVWAAMSRLNDTTVRRYIEGEHPQTAALVLSRLDRGFAARVIGGLGADLRNAVLARMFSLKTVADDALEALERALREDVAALAASSTGSHSGIADILNRLDKVQSEAALKALAAARPAEARALRSLLFTFEDLPSLSADALASILNQVPVDRLVTALRGTDEGFQAAVLAGLATRARRAVELEMRTSSETPAREVAEARRSIVDVVLKMIAGGQIELPASSFDGP